MSKLKISKNTIGISGEFYIAYILAKHGFQVNVSLGRTEGFDLFVKNPQGKNLTVSVKTTYSNKSNFFIMNKKAETLIEEDLFYAFVRLNMPNDEPEFWIIPSFVVAHVIKVAHEIHLKTPKKDGSAHKDTNFRLLRLQDNFKFPDDWEKQLEGFKSNVDSLR